MLHTVMMTLNRQLRAINIESIVEMRGHLVTIFSIQFVHASTAFPFPKLWLQLIISDRLAAATRGALGQERPLLD